MNRSFCFKCFSVDDCRCRSSRSIAQLRQLNAKLFQGTKSVVLKPVKK